MSTIDIRDNASVTIEKIVFSNADNEYGDAMAYYLKAQDDRMTINDDYDSIYIQDKSHAENLIKALQKAIELGWLK